MSCDPSVLPRRVTSDHDPLTGRQIRRFWAPLVLTSTAMTLAGPVLNVALGRAAQPTLELAGFWVAFSVMLLIQSASLVLQQVTVVLADAGAALRRLVAAALLLGALATSFMLTVALTPLGDVVLGGWIPTSARVAALARIVLLQLAPIPTLVALREVAAGLAIRERRTTLVAVSSAVRLLVIGALVAAAVTGGRVAGARTAAWALVTAVALETVFILVATAPLWKATWQRRPGKASVSRREILRVATPLLVAGLSWTAVRPVVNAVLGHLPDSDLAQASFGVVLPILLLSGSLLWGFHNVSLVLPCDRLELRRVVRFAAGTATLVAMGIGVVVLTPIQHHVLLTGFRLSPEMEREVAPALGWLVLAPFFLTARAVAQGLLMKARRTGIMLGVSPLKLGLMLLVGLAAAGGESVPNAATLAVLLIMGGDLFDAVIYGVLAGRLIDRGLVFRTPHTPTPSAASPPIAMAWPIVHPSLGNPR
jgi:hypothetical protein